MVSDFVPSRMRWSFIVMLPLGAVFGVLVAGLITPMVAKVHEAEALIEVPARAGAVMMQAFHLEELDLAMAELRVELERDREILVAEVRKWRAGKDNLEACIRAKDTWYETLDRLSRMNFERLEAEACQSVPTDEALIHQKPETQRSRESPYLLWNLTWGAFSGLLLAGCVTLAMRRFQSP